MGLYELEVFDFPNAWNLPRPRPLPRPRLLAIGPLITLRDSSVLLPSPSLSRVEEVTAPDSSCAESPPSSFSRASCKKKKKTNKQKTIISMKKKKKENKTAAHQSRNSSKPKQMASLIDRKVIIFLYQPYSFHVNNMIILSKLGPT